MKELHTVLSRQACKRLFHAPKLLKHRILLALVYSAGLRISEVIHLKQADIDFDRMQLHIRRSKYNKDRYVPLSVGIATGLKKYYDACQPREWVFVGKDGHSLMSSRGVQSLMRAAVKGAGIKKKASLHTLRDSYATHLLEDGLDLYSIQQLLGHEHVTTTLVYLHVAQRVAQQAHSPFDTLYPDAGQT
ncbi:MAG: tyrosine-type recombinase/integrase [Thermodesulfobacteriota bacterium]